MRDIQKDPQIEFEAWMTQVNALLVDLFMMDSDDLDDWNWADAYEDGMTPQEAVDEYREEVAADDDEEYEEDDAYGIEDSLFDMSDEELGDDFYDPMDFNL